MKTILVCNQKGGVGKSLVADEIAFSFERSGIPISFYDLDSQGGTIHTTTEVEDAAVAVVDTPGALQKDLKDWIADADLIVIPTRASTRDMDPLLRMKEASEGKPRIYVLNGWNRFRMSRDFMDWFKEFSGNDPIVRIPQAEPFVQAGAAEMSVVDFAPRSKAAKMTTEMVNAVRGAVGFDNE